MDRRTDESRLTGSAGTPADRRQETPAPVIEPDRFDAVLFDMDGVVTDTAEAHAAAWKRLFDDFLGRYAAETESAQAPFDQDVDYKDHVDGKPRLDGIRDFLASRGIDLPEGAEDDEAGAWTIQGLAKQKNGYFNAWLSENHVRVYEDARALIAGLRREDVGVGIFSSSKNLPKVLDNAGVLELFDTVFGGAELAAAGMPGKPDPAMLLEAARRLDADPARTAIVEDAVSGTEAGAAGHFALVVGVDRSGGDGDATAVRLKAHGADRVCSDLRDLLPNRGGRPRDAIPSAWDCLGEIEARAVQRRLVVFLDYDGTLTPIVPKPEDAVLSDDMRAHLRRLSGLCPVALVSGRDLKDLKQLVRVDRIVHAGSHGFDIEGAFGRRDRLAKGEAYIPDLDAAEKALKDALDGIDGTWVERKAFAIAVHFRRVAPPERARVARAVDRIMAAHAGRLRQGQGKMVFRIQPDMDWDKGRAVEWLLERLDLGAADVLPLYIGDDTTDEDAFASLAGRGVSIVVRDGGALSLADYALDDTDDVGRFLEALVDICARTQDSGADTAHGRLRS
jgi:alpha,alpha-trehalase